MGLPALFKQQDVWALITEAGLDGAYCATRLKNEPKAAVYKIAFPDPARDHGARWRTPAINSALFIHPGV